MRFWQKAGASASAVLMAAVGAVTTTSGASAAEQHRSERRSGVAVEVASFNVLGSHHTVGSRRYASGVTRAGMALRWLDRRGTSIVGMQEAQRDQAQVLTKGTGWGFFPDWRTSTDTQTAQSVMWRTDTWDLVHGRIFEVPFNRGRDRDIPVVLLQHKATGEQVYVVSVHLTAGRDWKARQERRVGTRLLVAEVNALKLTGVPVIVTGDMNDREPFFCPFMKATRFASPAGGTHTGTACKPPLRMRIDWIFSSPSVKWSGFEFAGGTSLRKITDHSVPVGTAHLP